jgi:hypothetical protein
MVISSSFGSVKAEQLSLHTRLQPLDGSPHPERKASWHAGWGAHRVPGHERNGGKLSFNIVIGWNGRKEVSLAVTA